MQSLCSRRSGEEATLSSWHRGGTLSHWGKGSRFRIYKISNWISSTRFVNGCSGLLGLTNLYQPLNVGIWKNIYEVHWTECSPICFPGQLSSVVENDFSKRLVIYFSSLPNLFDANGRINEADIFFFEATFLQDYGEKGLKNWHLFIILQQRG